VSRLSHFGSGPQRLLIVTEMKDPTQGNLFILGIFSLGSLHLLPPDILFPFAEKIFSARATE
jgi:hypothetical protein